MGKKGKKKGVSEEGGVSGSRQIQEPIAPAQRQPDDHQPRGPSQGQQQQRGPPHGQQKQQHQQRGTLADNVAQMQQLDIGTQAASSGSGGNWGHGGGGGARGRGGDSREAPRGRGDGGRGGAWGRGDGGGARGSGGNRGGVQERGGDNRDAPGGGGGAWGRGDGGGARGRGGDNRDAPHGRGNGGGGGGARGRGGDGGGARGRGGDNRDAPHGRGNGGGGGGARGRGGDGGGARGRGGDNRDAPRGRGDGGGGGAWGRGDGGGARGRGGDNRDAPHGRGNGGGGGGARGRGGDGGGAWARGGPCTEKREFSPGSSSSAKSFTDAGSVKSTGGGSGQTEKKTVPEHEKSRLMSLIPRRKNPGQAGSEGRKISVLTNMIKIVCKSNFKILAMHYDIKFDPDKPKYIKKPTFAALRQKHFPNCWPAFDGRVNVYSAGDLPFGSSLSTEVTFFDEEWQRERTVKVTMDKVNEIDMSWLTSVKPGIDESIRDQTTMQVLDVILRMAPYNRAIMVGRSFFQQPTRPAFDLSDGMELWVGMFQSAVLGWRPYFNVDVAHKAFPKSEDVIEVMKDLCADRNGRPRDLNEDLFHYNKQKIEQHFRGLKVIYQLPNQPSTKRTVGVNGFDRPADKATFTLDNGDTTTVERYFHGSKKYKLRYPQLPCLWVGSRNKHVLVPPELCKVAPGVVTNRKLGEEQTRRMIRETAKEPAVRKQRIMDAFNGMKFNDDPTMKEFGITLDGNFETVNARVLAPPTLQYAGRTAMVQKGVWRTPGSFNRASDIPENQWTILNLSQRMQDNTLERFISSLQRIGKGNGMNIQTPRRPFQYMRLHQGRDARELTNYLAEQKKAGMKLILVVIPGFGADVYPKVKQQAELQVGILTQCVKDKTVDKICNYNDDATTGNILLKINSKLNGVNHTIASNTKLDCLNGAIIFGADVTHPSPDATEIPSIAAVAASHSSDVFKYNVMIRLQPPRQEIILHLEEIVIEQLKIYMKGNNNEKPNKILFYRDGVSEGQFPTVMHYELQAIKNACKKLGGQNKYEPKITFLVVQKRHHIRLFPTDKRNSDDKNGNVQAGTIVDTTITHPSHIDFYLVSHASIQGTARPTKYRCLWDDNNMTEDDIEKLTYYLCHMFSRCNRSVSYPAPTYYAHLAAFRARALTHGVSIQMNNLEQAQLRNLTLKPDLVNNNPMFFV